MIPVAGEDQQVVYRGVRQERGGRCVVSVETIDGQLLGQLVPVPRHPTHSPTGFQWGYGGSGPAELARSLLLAALGDRATCLVCDGQRRVVYDPVSRLERRYQAGRDHPDEAISCGTCADGRRAVPYQEFKRQFVAGWGRQWQMSRRDILAWLQAHGVEP